MLTMAFCDTKTNSVWVLMLATHMALLWITSVQIIGGTTLENKDVFTCESVDMTASDTHVATTKACKKVEKYCYVLWQNSSSFGGVKLLMKGCWVNEECKGRTTCAELEEKTDDSHFFCCCNTPMCNREFFYQPITKNATKIIRDVPVMKPHKDVLNTMLYSLVPLVSVTILIVVIFWMWRRHKASQHEPLATDDPMLISPNLPATNLIPNMFGGVPGKSQEQLCPIQLKEIKARGRFGCVWRAEMRDLQVAVKTFPLQDQQSWLLETEIYHLPHVNDNPNILHFVGAEQRKTDDFSPELWLITEFHPHGSLCDFLKGNLISWKQLLILAETMAKGLAFLHEDIPKCSRYHAKPAVAHRDFKSKNVLVKADLTACIADFGLALKFEFGKSPGDVHGQVGTRRYMAPEVLEGAISFNRDAFLRIDMYACGLVLWELVSRCSAADGPVADYRLPFEEEIGQHPTLDDMQEVVVHKKVRPLCKDQWFLHSGLQSLCETIYECWDHDAEARLSSRCIEERLAALTKLDISTQPKSVMLPEVDTTRSKDYTI